MTQAQTGCHIGMNLLGSSGCHCWLELGCQSVDRAIQRSGAYLSRPHFILKRIQHGKRLKTSQRCPYLAGENVSKTKRKRGWGLRRKGEGKTRIWSLEEFKSHRMGSRHRMPPPCVAATPRGLPLCTRMHLQGLAAHDCLHMAVFWWTRLGEFWE